MKNLMKFSVASLMMLVLTVSCKKDEPIQPNSPVNAVNEKTVYFYAGTYDAPNIYNQGGIYNADGHSFYQENNTFHSPTINDYVCINSYNLINDVLEIDITNIYTNANLQLQAQKTSLTYDDYGIGSNTDHNQFNGLYYCPQENFLYALDYSKGFITIYFISAKTKIQKTFTWNNSGASGPEIEFSMDDNSTWCISYQPFAPSPMSGIYQLRTTINNTVSTRQVFVIDDKR